MFRSARLKLTAWYLAIIMIISVFFSFAAYQTAVVELERGLHAQMMRSLGQNGIPGSPGSGLSQPEPPTPGGSAPDLNVPPALSAIESQLLQEGSRREAEQLVFLNILIFILAGWAGYFLAGRTLRPIEEMVNEQKRFVADASHELRTPLTVMRTETEVALRDEQLDAGEAREVLESSLEEIAKLQSLSDYLLTMGRLQEVEVDTLCAQVKLGDLVSEARHRVGALADEKHVTIESKVEEGALEGLRDHLLQMLVIFLDNAVKYSHEGGRVEISGRLQKNQVVLHVCDNGIGMRASDLPYIFNRFYRADTSRSKKGADGYGLGLSIAKSIIDLHRGSVEVESSPGVGTTFTIVIPRLRQSAGRAHLDDTYERIKKALVSKIAILRAQHSKPEDVGPTA